MSTPPSAIAFSAADQALREAAVALRRDADRIASAVADILTNEVSAASFDPLTREETRRTCRATLIALLDAWRRGESLDHIDPPGELLFQIEVLARDGIPLRPFTRMCRLAHGAFVDAWDAELGRANLSREVQLAAIRTAHQLTFQWFDTLLEQLTEVYETELDRLARTPDTIRRATVRSALSGKSVDVDVLSRAAGYEFRRRHVGLIFWHATPAVDGVPAAADAQPAFRAIGQRIASTVGAGPPLVVSAGSSVAWAWIGMRGPVDAGAIARAADAERHGGVAITIGDAATGLEGFRHTHEDAVAASRVIMLLGADAPPRATPYASVELVAMLCADVRRARQFTRRWLGELARDDDTHAQLRATLEVHLDGQGNRLEAARRLGVHPNTVSNRVRAAAGLLPDAGSLQQVELRVALLVADTLGATVLTTETAV